MFQETGWLTESNYLHGGIFPHRKNQVNYIEQESKKSIYPKIIKLLAISKPKKQFQLYS